MAEITASTKNTGKKYPDSYRDKNIMVDYKYSSARFYKTGADDPIAIGFRFLTHWKGVIYM